MARFSSFLKENNPGGSSYLDRAGESGHRFTYSSIMLRHPEEVNDGGKNHRGR